MMIEEFKRCSFIDTDMLESERITVFSHSSHIM